jgi:hypothetical protein
VITSSTIFCACFTASRAVSRPRRWTVKDFGGPLKGGMPIYKYVGNKILTFLENSALNLNLTEFHSG